tara:strand:+ start:105 stop:452 length:348 start_codon:yes stop_codon:yes gene_type:complete
MAVPLKIKVPWWRKFHYRNIWRIIKHDWRHNCSVKEMLWEDRYSYLIIIAGVKIGLLISLLTVTTGCTGTWVWQEQYPKHRTMSFKCPRWNYDEAYDSLHHAWSTQQHVPIKIKK